MKRSILAVDAEVHMVRLLERIIREKTNYQIKVTHNALEVPDLMNKESFDVIIAELMMPGFNGLDLLDKIARDKRTEAVIVMATEQNLKNTVEAFRRGASDVVIKPFKAEQLFEAIERAMNISERNRKSCCMTELLDIHPFSEALEAFKRDYIRCLTRETGRDVGKIADISGLSRSEIEKILNSLS
ncbi:MAG: response regulator [Candidatus Zixiibacteriota bacterium]